MDFMMGKYDISDFSGLWKTLARHTGPSCLLELSGGPDAHSPVRADLDIILTTETRQDADVLKVVRIYQEILSEIAPDTTGKALTCLLLDKPSYVSDGKTKNGFHLHFPYAALKNADQSRILTPMVRERVRKAGLFFKCKYDVDDIAMKPWLVYGSAKSRDAESYRVTRAFNHSGAEIKLSAVTRSKDPHMRVFPKLLSVRDYTAPMYDPDTKFLEPPKPKHVPSPHHTTGDPHSTIRVLLGKMDTGRRDRYSDWISVGMSIYGATDGEGFLLWDSWSRKGYNYRSDVMDQKWRSFSNTEATIGTLKWMVRQDNGQTCAPVRGRLLMKPIPTHTSGVSDTYVCLLKRR
jgi:hypothetical protein